MSALTIPLETIKELSTRVVALQSMVPKTPQGFPLAYVDPERILATGMLEPAEELLEKPPDGALVTINHNEGFPTVDGLPFWERLDGEPIPYYELFKGYRRLGPSRSLYRVAQTSSMSIREVRAISQTWHWQLRARAFDVYEERLVQIERRQQIRLMEGDHYKAARQLFELCMGYLKNNAADLTPRSATGLLDLAIKMQRLSLGLQPDKPVAGSDPAVLVQNNIYNQGEMRVDMSHDGESRRARVSEILTVLQNAGALAFEIPIEATKAAEAPPAVAATGTEGAVVDAEPI